jgi:hypothetical protein
MAIVRVATDVGAWLELVGTTVAIAWIAVYALALVTVPVAVGIRQERQEQETADYEATVR